MAAKTKQELKQDAQDIFIGGFANITAAKVKTFAIDLIDSFVGSSSTSIKVTNSLEDDGSGAFQLKNDAESPGNDKYYGTNNSGAKGFYALPAAQESGNKLIFDTIPLQPGTFTAGGQAGHQRLLEANNIYYHFFPPSDISQIEIVKFTIVLHATPSGNTAVNLHWGDANEKIFKSDLSLTSPSTVYEVVESQMTEKRIVPTTSWRRLELLNTLAIEEVAATMTIYYKVTKNN